MEDILVLFPHDVTQPTKRLWLAQRAVDKLRVTEPRARLWIVNGRSPDDMPWFYAASNVMLVTSVLESGPSSAKEALACGVPVVSVAVGDLELFQDVPDAMLLSGPSEEDLADSLMKGLRVGSEPRRSRLPRQLTLDSAARRVEAVYAAAVRAFSQ